MSVHLQKEGIMLNKELFDQIKDIDVNEVETKYAQLKSFVGEETSLERFKTLIKAAKNSINFEEWTSIVSGIENNVGPMKMSMQELESLRGGRVAGSNFGWNQIFSATSITEKERLMKQAIEQSKSREARQQPCAAPTKIGR